MNSLIYNPHIQHIEEWNSIYLSQKAITSFQNIIERTCNSLSVISTHKSKKQISLTSTNENIDQRKTSPNNQLGNQKREFSIRDEGGIERLSEQINQLKANFQKQYKQILNKQIQNEQISVTRVVQSTSNVQTQVSNFKQKLEIFENHLKKVKDKGLDFYDQFVDQEVELLQAFVFYKLSQLRIKFQKVKRFLSQKKLIKEDSKAIQQVRVVFDNLYIETEYLRVLTHKNTQIYEMHVQNEYSAGQPHMISMRNREFRRLKKCEEQIQNLKKAIRELYFEHYRKKRGKEIKNHHRLQMHIRNEIAVNKSDFQPQGSLRMWIHGFVFAILLISLCGIIIFRETNIVQLEKRQDYYIDFQVWRGASYLISFNWVLAIVTYLYEKIGINFRMIRLQYNKYIEKPQSFFLTASVLSAIFLVLFLVYLLKQLNYIVGYDHLRYLPYYMWGINIVFMLNPFKILNYHTRIYFMDILLKNLQLMWRPINFNLYFLGLIMGSFAQPMNDFSFTVCQLIHSDQKRCVVQGRNATFIFLLIYVYFRIIQSFRIHAQYSPNILISRGRQGLLACIFMLKTVISSFLYGTYKTSQMLTYWIENASISTITFTNADLRVNWGLITFDEEDCFLRKHKIFKRHVYFICAGIDLILNVGWALTISTQIADYLRINIIYFLLLLQNIEFCRRGMWMIFSIEDEHMRNVANLNAMAYDSQLIKHIEATIELAKNKQKQNQQEMQPSDQKRNKKQVNSVQAKNKIEIEERPWVGSGINLRNQYIQSQHTNQKMDSLPLLDLKQLQALIDKKHRELVKVQSFLKTLQGYLNIIHELYQRLQWQDQY